MLSKSAVSGPARNGLYAALDKATGKTPQWNFHKYLIDRSGKVVASFPSDVTPDNPALLQAVDQALR